jgi:transcriptional regulator GlxA family with amidase domain
MDPRVAHAIKHLEQSIERSPSVPELANLVGLSPSRFAHLFRDEAGVPPVRYLHRLRMERARALLERTFLTVRDVMRQVGFRDPSHFARDFRRYHGVAPSAIRGRKQLPGPLSGAVADELITGGRAVADDAGAHPAKPSPTGDPSKTHRRE